MLALGASLCRENVAEYDPGDKHHFSITFLWGPCPGWVTLSKSLYLFWGLGFLTCEMGIVASHRTGVGISDKVSVQSACHMVGFGQMVALVTIITM